MDLKRIFIVNLRKFRNDKGISQMRLAELCDTATNYIGEIEIGRRFPSLSLIEKIGAALDVSPYRFFMEESAVDDSSLKELADTLAGMSDKALLHVIHLISARPR
jgi:transcriptional regulator with XRE-family HTH domain